MRLRMELADRDQKICELRNMIQSRNDDLMDILDLVLETPQETKTVEILTKFRDKKITLVKEQLDLLNKSIF
jgi:hypothetical protein